MVPPNSRLYPQRIQPIVRLPETLFPSTTSPRPQLLGTPPFNRNIGEFEETLPLMTKPKWTSFFRHLLYSFTCVWDDFPATKCPVKDRGLFAFSSKSTRLFQLTHFSAIQSDDWFLSPNVKHFEGTSFTPTQDSSKPTCPSLFSTNRRVSLRWIDG